MKTRYFILSLAAAALLASCAKEQPAPEETIPAEEPQIQTFLTVGLEPQTKTVMDAVKDSENKHKVYWTAGDQISVNGKASNALAVADLPTPYEETATFSFADNLETPYNVLYPASAYKDATHVTLPAVQDYREGSFADGMSPMAGYSADGSALTLKHLCAILKVSVKRASTGTVDEDSIVSIRFKGRNNEQVSGEFTIDYSNATLTGTSTAEADKVVKVAKIQATSTSEAVVYYIVVPAINYSQGFDIIVQDQKGHLMTKSRTSGKTLEAGKLYSLVEFNFVPGTDTEESILISSAEELVAFAQRYNGGESDLSAKLANDITFDATTSAAFNATGGIGVKEGVNGSERYYFCGTFDGNNCTIKNLAATVPLFCATDDGSKIYDLTVDNTCSFTFTHSNTIEGMFGSIVGYHRGELNNVKSAANVTLAAKADVIKLTSLGGLVGRAVTGTVKNSEYSGLISTPSDFTSTEKLIIGGLVGRFSNSGSVTGSYFKGAISNEAQITSTDTTNPYLIIGGVVGLVEGGASITSCTTTTDHADEASAYSGFEGKIVNKTTVAYNSALGGIVGELSNGTVTSCTNAATIAISIYKVGADGSRYMKTGGIVGKNNSNGSITGCTNNGSVQHRSNPKYQSLGGIAGYNAGTITNCTNNAAVNQMSSGKTVKAGRYVYLGGVIGENVASNKVSNVHNTANVEISSMEENSNSTECIGGVIGYNKGTVVGGDTKDITNTGQVYHSPNFTTQIAGFYLGGIAGLTTAAVKNAKNTGRTYFRWQGTTIGACGVYIGGIAGKAEGESSTIESCENTVDSGITNSAQVYLYLPGNSSHKDNYVGGIVGLSEATNPVKDCTNGGEVRTAAGASTTPVTGIMMGGVIGKMTGSGNVDNADNGGRVRINFTKATDGHSGNYLGGIVGYVVNASTVTVKDCDNSGQVDISCGDGLVQNFIVSGVVGRMDAPGSITSCKNNGGAIQMTITANSVGPKDLYAAGVLGYSANDVTISGCSNSGAISGGNSTRVDNTAFYAGGIVAYLKGASKILNCSNTGSTATTHAGNVDTIGSTTLTGGIAGYVEGTSASPIEIGGTTGCTVNTGSTALSATRGWIGGIAAYAKYAEISNCTIESIIGGGCAARGAGGVVGKAEYCTISSSSYKGDQIKANQIQASTGEGGIVGNLDNSTIDGCSCYATKFYNNNSQPFGCIVGISGSNNTIQNCHYKDSVEGPTSGTAATAKVAGSGTFSGTNNLADL